MTTKLDKLLEKEAQLKAQIQQAKAAERTLEKKHDTRRKILIGAAVMARVESGRWPKVDLIEMMDGFLTRPNERELFDLDEAVVTTAELPVKEKAKAAEAVGAKAGRKKTEKKAGTAAGRRERALPESSADLENEFNL